MKYVDEYRNAPAVAHYRQAIAGEITQPWTLMEICGGQTHSIVKYGLDTLLPRKLTLIHGPGCPVCVTPMELIDQALWLARQPEIIFCSFGDMLRVPGSGEDLLTVKARGGDVRIVYSPLDCLAIAKDNPNREVVFFAVGFETTAPATALTLYQARAQRISNFSVLAAHVLVPPAMEALLANSNSLVQGFLAAGHVCTVMGTEIYQFIAQRYQIPIVITGFEPVDIMQGILACVHQLESGQFSCENQYRRSVQAQGNPHAQKIIEQVFEPVDRHWRGLGLIPASGLGLKWEFTPWDSAVKFAPLLKTMAPGTQETVCISGEILQGQRKPSDCPAFGTTCTPERPLGAPMVSSEGACAAYHRYRQKLPEQREISIV
ncbi:MULTISPECIES: hydrogenase formation protein HypD [unclassified Synechocystis]|uniref:hydrogenase formation protein HypD n=1 Tax=unclassified Synechocystis TaxID=2640012 RepID=UPI0004901AFD|nr:MULTISPECIES: hydrogenase formation protein HypD [unclassified Synechocystis]AIE75161.1 [NiFe] hydrogenase metallocenter assembly protein HypD [Synechocystis sp. PCC 6714]MCT0252923.1 hydrogenase formation protein HypD [Synechocystis sp. CS-94]